MGYNTPVLILNDAMEGLKTDPNVGKKLYDAIGETQLREYRQNGRSFSIGNHANGGLAFESRHADEAQIIAVGGNCMTRITNLYYGWSDMNDPAKLLARMADQLGYKLVPKK